MSGIDWQFGGLLRDVPPPVAWALLGAAAVLGGALIFWSYRHTLRPLPSATRWTLVALRCGLLALLLLILANPSLSHRPPEPESSRDTLAVVIDRSASMSMPDYREATRLQHAVQLWSRHSQEAGEAFRRIEFRPFSNNLGPAEAFRDAVEKGEPGPDTRLYSSLEEAIAARPGAVVCLTDGVDTTGADSAGLLRNAQSLGVPIYFAVGRNKARAQDLLSIREMQTPVQVLRRTDFSAAAVFDIASSTKQEIPAELWNGDHLIAKTRLAVHPGMNTIPWRVPIGSEEAGRMVLEFRLGEGSLRQVAAGTTEVVERTGVNILYYQGTLLWGYHFLLSALEGDPSFRLTGILNPDLDVHLTRSAGGQGVPFLALPDTAEPLKPYQVVVLANVFADQLSARQQQALVDYTRSGGSLLFITPDTEAASRFSGTAMEQMLPVVFDSPESPATQDWRLDEFQRQMSGLSNVGDYDTRLAGFLMSTREKPSELLPFAVPEGAKKSPLTTLFRSGKPQDRPKFSEAAHVKGVKPGAEVLAVHPDDPSSVLLARQQFGQGFSLVLTTDLLWRWKMSLPSASRAAETFWQQFFLSLAPLPQSGLRFVKSPEPALLKHPLPLHLEGASAGEPPVATATAPDGSRQPIALQADASGSARWNLRFAPDKTGQWQIEAKDSAGRTAMLSLPVAESSRSTETLAVPPDIEGLRKLASATGGALLEEDPVFRPRQATAPNPMKRTTPAWTSGWLLACLLGFYGAEMLLRRWKRLL